MNILPRDYLSHSQKSTFLWSKKRYLETYYYGKFESSPYLELGKELADALEFREKKYEPHIRAIIDQMPDAPQREYKIEAKLGGIKLLGILDGYDKKKRIITEYKTGQKPSVASWKKQMVFYSLLIFLTKKKLPTKIKLFHASTMFNEDQQLVFTGNVKEYEIKVTMEDILLLSAELKKVWGDIKDLCEREYKMFGPPIKSKKNGRQPK